MKSITARQPQAGMTYMGMLIMLIVIAFFAVVLIKVLPLYMEHFNVTSSLKSLAKDTKDGQGAKTPMEVEKLLSNRLSINDVQHVTRDDIKVTRDGHRLVVDVSYEARVHLFGNLDVVAKFPDNRVELGGP